MSGQNGKSGLVYIAITGIVIMLLASAFLRSSSEAHVRCHPQPECASQSQITPVVIGLAPPPVATSTYDKTTYVQEADLIAQRWMAWWTGVLGLSGIAAMILSIVGIILIWRNLEATRGALKQAEESTRATRQIGEAQVTSYVQPVKVSLRFQDTYIDAALSTSVYGQTAAMNLELQCSVEITDSENEISATLSERGRHDKPHAFQKPIEVIQQFNLPDGIDFDRKPRVVMGNRHIPKRRFKFKITGFVQYENVFGAVYRSHFTFSRNWQGGFEIPAAVDIEDDTSPKYFELIYRKERKTMLMTKSH